MAVPIKQTAGAGTGNLLADVRRAAPSADSVAGNEVLQADNSSKIYSYFPLVLIIVSLVTFLFLARALRSIVLPLKAVALNLLSVAATYGATVLIWQKGIGLHALFGLNSNGAVNALAPILLFGFLFGLSMDYEVFILSRMREAYDRTGNTTPPSSKASDEREGSSLARPSLVRRRWCRCRPHQTSSSKSSPPALPPAYSSTPSSCDHYSLLHSSASSTKPTGGCRQPSPGYFHIA